MIITYIHEENVKGLKVIELEPGPEGVTLVGNNGAGKSSLLDGIIYALNGGKDIPDDVIRETQRKAEVRLHLGGDPDGMELKITKTFTKGNTKGKLKIEGYDGDLTPQRLLDTIVGAISFNPTKFMEASPKKQRDMLLEGLGLTEKLAEIEAQETAKYRQRTEVGRDKSRAEAHLEAHPKVPVPEAVDIEAKQAELDRIEEQNKVHDEWSLRRHRLEETIQLREEKRDQLKAELEKVEEALASEQNMLAALDKNKPPVPVDTAEIDSELREAGAVNERHRQAVEQNERHKEALEIATRHRAEYDKLTNEIEAIRASKASLLADVEWPMEGLDFDDDGLILNDRKFEVSSLAERIRAACLIGMAMNPRLRVMIIDGNALDQDNLALIKDIAREKNYQLWIEMVRSDGSPCIEIEDGMIKETDNDESE